MNDSAEESKSPLDKAIEEQKELVDREERKLIKLRAEKRGPAPGLTQFSNTTLLDELALRHGRPNVISSYNPGHNSQYNYDFRLWRENSKPAHFEMPPTTARAAMAHTETMLRKQGGFKLKDGEFELLRSIFAPKVVLEEPLSVNKAMSQLVDAYHNRVIDAGSENVNLPNCESILFAKRGDNCYNVSVRPADNTKPLLPATANQSNGSQKYERIPADKVKDSVTVPRACASVDLKPVDLGSLKELIQLAYEDGARHGIRPQGYLWSPETREALRQYKRLTAGECVDYLLDEYVRNFEDRHVYTRTRAGKNYVVSVWDKEIEAVPPQVVAGSGVVEEIKRTAITCMGSAASSQKAYDAYTAALAKLITLPEPSDYWKQNVKPHHNGIDFCFPSLTSGMLISHADVLPFISLLLQVHQSNPDAPKAEASK